MFEFESSREKKKVVIQDITIKNFKGIASFKTDFNADVTRFYGSNGSGKSTIKNAWEWALCRNVSDYLPNINNQEIPNLITSVIVNILVNDLHYELCRESKPKYGKNGEKTGNESKYLIDGIEVGQKQYQSQIANIIGNIEFDQLAMLTDKEFFNTDTSAWKWTHRRKVLLSMTGAEREANRIAEKEKYASIKEFITKGYSTSDVKSTLIKDCNSLKKQQDANLVLIESKQKEIDEYLGINFEKVSQELAVNKTKYTKLLNSSKNENIADELKKIDEELLVYSQELSAVKTRDMLRRRDLEDFKLKIYQEAIETKAEYDRTSKNIKQVQEELDLLAKEEIKDSCPICGQKLPAEKIEDAQMKHLSRVEKYSGDLKTLKESAKSLYEKYNSLQKQYAKQDEEIKNFVPNEKIEFFESKISALKQTIEDKRKSTLSNLSKQELSGLQEQISNLEREMAKKEYLEKANNQIKAWKQDNLRIADELIKIENKERALQDFVREQTEIISQTVNSFFGNGVSWSLYTVNYLGNLEETCELMYNNKLYSCLSVGERNVANLETIKALQKFYDVNLPVICDNNESVTIPYETDCQRIELYATPDKKLENCVKITDIY